MKWELPDNVNPPDTVCVQFQVPNDPLYIAAFWGAITELGNWFNWQHDSARTAARAAMRMRKMYLAAQLLNCPPAPSGKGTGGYYRRGNMFQQPTDNPCLLQAQCPDGTWDTIYDGALCFVNPAPGGGKTPPAAGKCQEYMIGFHANSLTILPFLVNTGDTLAITTLVGAGNDGTLNWYCINGQYFIGGTCSGGEFTVGTDPVPTANHMSCVLKIGSSYYSFNSGTFTVPSGVVNEQIYIGVNDAPISDNSGDYAIDFVYCNNSAVPTVPWCHNSDFTVSPDAWVAPGYPGGGGFCETGTLASGLWSSGNGWRGQLYHQGDCTDLSVLTYIALDLGAPTALTNIQLDFDLETVAHPFDSWEIFGSTTLNNSGDVGLASASNPGTGPKSVVWTGTATYRYVKISLIKLQNAGSSPTATITSVQIKGTGANPFGSSNC